MDIQSLREASPKGWLYSDPTLYVPLVIVATYFNKILNPCIIIVHKLAISNYHFRAGLLLLAHNAQHSTGYLTSNNRYLLYWGPYTNFTGQLPVNVYSKADAIVAYSD